MQDPSPPRASSYRWLLIALAGAVAVYSLYVMAHYGRLNDLHRRELASAASELSRTFENAVSTVRNLGPSAATICDFATDQRYLAIENCADQTITLGGSAEIKQNELIISNGTAKFSFLPDVVLQELPFPDSFQLVVLARESDGKVLFQDEPARRQWLRQLRWGEQRFRDSAADQSSGQQIDNLKNLLGSNADPDWSQLSAASALTRLTLGGAWVQLHLQPVRFGESTLIMGGMVPLEEILRQALAVDTYFVALLAFVFLLGALGFPFVKLLSLAPSERFRLRDVYLLILSTGALLALVTFVVVGWDAYFRWRGDADLGLQHFAVGLENGLLREVRQARDQLASYDKKLPAAYAKYATTAKPEDRTCQKWPVKNDWFEDTTLALAPLGQHIVMETVAWIRPDGVQIWKITAGKANTRKINVGGRPYFRAVRDGNLYRIQTPDGAVEEEGDFFVAPDRSITDGAFKTFISIPSVSLPGACVAKTQDSEGRYVAMATVRLSSIDRTPLPAGYGFAILTREGRVLYHSDTRLSLRENFFAELSEGPRVRAAIYAGRSQTLPSRYRERPHRIFVKPLRLSLIRPSKDFLIPGEELRLGINGREPKPESAGLHLAVFRDVSMGRAIAARVVTTSLLGPMLLLLALGSSGLALMVRAAKRRHGRPGVWLWPKGDLDDAQRTVTKGLVALLAGGVLISLVLVRTSLGGGDLVFLAMPFVAIVLARLMFNRARLRLNNSHEKLRSPGWRTAMLTVLLTCVVIVPSATLFHLAIGHEFGKLIKTEQESMVAKIQDGPLIVRAEALADGYSSSTAESIARAHVHRFGDWPEPYNRPLEPISWRAHMLIAPNDWLDNALPVDNNTLVREREQDVDFTYVPAGAFGTLPLSWVALLSLVVVIGLISWWIRWTTVRLFHGDLAPSAPRMLPATEFEASWAACTEDERYVLIQVAHEGIANPSQRPLVDSLLSRELLCLDPDLLPNSPDFTQFLLGKERENQAALRSWEEGRGPHSWQHIRILLFGSMGAVAVFVVATQPGLQSELVGIVTAVTGGLTTLVKIRDAIVSWMSKGKLPS